MPQARVPYQSHHFLVRCFCKLVVYGVMVRYKVGALTSYASLPSFTKIPQSPNFKMEDVHNDIGSAIEEDKMPSNQHMRAVRRRRR